jgi:hypothetical protein
MDIREHSSIHHRLQGYHNHQWHQRHQRDIVHHGHHNVNRPVWIRGSRTSVVKFVNQCAYPALCCGSGSYLSWWYDPTVQSSEAPDLYEGGRWSLRILIRNTVINYSIVIEIITWISVTSNRAATLNIPYFASVPSFPEGSHFFRNNLSV